MFRGKLAGCCTSVTGPRAFDAFGSSAGYAQFDPIDTHAGVSKAGASGDSVTSVGEKENFEKTRKNGQIYEVRVVGGAKSIAEFNEQRLITGRWKINGGFPGQSLSRSRITVSIRPHD